MKREEIREQGIGKREQEERTRRGASLPTLNGYRILSACRVSQNLLNV